MNINLAKAQADLDKIRQQKADLIERLENLSTSESQLVSFINLTLAYAVVAEPTIPNPGSHVPPIDLQQPQAKITARASMVRFQPHKFPPVPIPEGYVSANRRMELVRRIVENFDPDTIIGAAEIAEKLAPVYNIPDNARSTNHHIASVLFHEKGPSAAIEKVDGGRWRVRANALEIVQSRIAAEIAEAQAAEARRVAQ